MIAAFDFKLNNCPACENIHSEVARHLCNLNEREIEIIKISYETAEISNRLKTVLSIAEQTKRDGKNVTVELYVDGLGTWAPHEHQFYINRAAQRAEKGYLEFDITK